LEIDIKMRLKLILLPLVLLICFSFANANDKTASNKEGPALAVADEDGNLIPAAAKKYDDNDNKEIENDESDADDQPAAKEDEPENDSTELEDQKYDAADEKHPPVFFSPGLGMADPKPFWGRRRRTRSGTSYPPLPDRRRRRVVTYRRRVLPYRRRVFTNRRRCTCRRRNTNTINSHGSEYYRRRYYINYVSRRRSG